MITLAFMLCITQAFAQGSVTGSVRDQQQAGVPFATIVLLKSGDSSKVQGSFADEKGAFSIRNVPFGSYLLSISSEGFTMAYSAPFELSADKSSFDAGTISLAGKTNNLSGVVVRTRKPVLEKRADRFVMNVSAGTFQADDLMKIFSALPFLNVEGESVTLNGKTNLLVLVDNVPRPKETLTTLFQSMTGQDIERIEFITNPSAQYDGTADAVINIITKKGQLQGLTGYARASGSQGLYANGNAGVNVTYRKRRLVLNASANINGGTFLLENFGYRVLQLQNQRLVLNDKPFDLNKIRTLSGVLRVEYSLGKTHLLGAQVDGNFRRMLDGSRWSNRIEFSGAVGGMADSVLRALQHANSQTDIVNYSLSYSGKLDSMGRHSLSAAFVYTPVNKRTMNEMQYQNIEDSRGDILTKLPVIRNTNPSRSSIKVAQADGQFRLANKWQLNSGVKFNFATLESSPFQETRTSSGAWQLTPEYSFSNLYEERILAGYLGLQKSFGKFSMNASARAERTMMSVRGVYEKNFTDVLPSLLLQQKFSKDYQMAFNYKRSINRPSFVELTPYRIYLDNYTILVGNPALVPQTTDAFNLNGNFRDKLFADLDYSDSKNSFSQLPMQIEDTTVWQVVNLNAKYFSGTITYNFRFSDWWQGNVMVRGTYFDTDGQLNNEWISNDGLALIAGINNTYSLPRDMKLDLGFNYRSPRPYGLATSRKRSYVRVALKGNLIEKKLQYTITAQDLFRDDYFGFDLNTSRLESRFYTFNDSRRVTVGLVYNFGKSTVKAAQEKRLENEDLLNRAN